MRFSVLVALQLVALGAYSFVFGDVERQPAAAALDPAALAEEFHWLSPILFAPDDALDLVVRSAAERATSGAKLVYVVTIHAFRGLWMEEFWVEALDLLHNLLESARRASVRNVLVFTSSREAEALALEHDGIVYFDEALADAGPQPFDQQDTFKFRHAAAVLVRGFDAVVVDIDVAFLSDPTPYFLPRTHPIEFMGEPTTNEHNVGFMYARSEPAVVGLLLDVAETLLAEPPREERPAGAPAFRSGQAIMSEILRGKARGVSGRAWASSIRLSELPLDMFAESEFFFVARRPQQRGVRPFVAHANGQPLQHGAKKFVLRNEGLWFVDPPSYYEGPFISYTLDAPSERLGWDDHASAFRDMLALSDALGRPLLAPRVPCRFHPLSGPWRMPETCLPTAYFASGPLLEHFPSLREATLFEHGNGPGRPPPTTLRLACPGRRGPCEVGHETVRAALGDAAPRLLHVELEAGVRVVPEAGAWDLRMRAERALSCVQHHLMYVAVRVFGRRWPFSEACAWVPEGAVDPSTAGYFH